MTTRQIADIILAGGYQSTTTGSALRNSVYSTLYRVKEKFKRMGNAWGLVEWDEYPNKEEAHE